MQPIIMEGPYPDFEENLKNRQFQRRDQNGNLVISSRPLPPIYGPVGRRTDVSNITPKGYAIIVPRTSPQRPFIQSPFRPPVGYPSRPFIPPRMPGVTRPGVGVAKPALPPPRPIPQTRPGAAIRPMVPGVPSRPIAHPAAVYRPATPYRPGAQVAGRPSVPGYRPPTIPTRPRPIVPTTCTCYNQLPLLQRIQRLKFLEEQDYFMMMQRYEWMRYFKKRLNRLWWWRRCPCYQLHGPHAHPHNYSQRRWWRKQAARHGINLRPSPHYGLPLNRYGRPISYKRYNPLAWWRNPANLRQPAMKPVSFAPKPKAIGFQPIRPPPIRHPLYSRRYQLFLRHNYPWLYHRYRRHCISPFHRYRMRHYYPYYTPRWVRRYHFHMFGNPWFTHRTPVMYYGPRMRYKPYIYHPRRHPWLYYPYHQYFPPSYYYY